MDDVSWLPPRNGQPRDAAIVDGVEDLAMVERGDDLAPCWPEIIGRVSAITSSDVKGIDFRIGRQFGPTARLDVVERSDGDLEQ